MLANRHSCVLIAEFLIKLGVAHERQNQVARLLYRAGFHNLIAIIGAARDGDAQPFSGSKIDWDSQGPVCDINLT